MRSGWRRIARNGSSRWEMNRPATSTTRMSTVSLSRLDREIDELAAISAHPAPAVTRVLFSAEDLKARDWLRARAKEAGFHVRQDPVGNVFIRWEGSEPCLPAV